MNKQKQILDFYIKSNKIRKNKIKSFIKNLISINPNIQIDNDDVITMFMDLSKYTGRQECIECRINLEGIMIAHSIGVEYKKVTFKNKKIFKKMKNKVMPKIENNTDVTLDDIINNFNSATKISRKEKLKKIINN